MNKYLYRVIFNKKRGIQMVVADIAKTPTGHEKSTSGLGQTLSKSVLATLKPVTLLMSISFGFVTLSLPAHGSQIIADPQAKKTQQAQVIQAANGVTQVNIQTPNKKGLSHNKYKQFDVSQRGVILNNSGKITQTQIGGYVQGNEYLKTGSAKIILNEVNSRNPSQLNGVIEVAGQKAQVIIANPSGISCHGCGFINADRSTLTTGKPIIDNGELTGYQVEQGHISVAGKGLDSTGQSYTDLIARSVSINSAVWANDLNVVTGRNKVSRNAQTITPLAEDNSPKPEVALDVSALGGMYAGKIQMVGTEKGVGVYNEGELGARTGSIKLSADGKIVNKGIIQANEHLVFNSRKGINNQKQLYAKKNIDLKTQESITNTQTIVAHKNVTLTADKIENTATGTFVAGVDSSGKLNNPGVLSLNANQVVSKGKSLAGHQINIQAGDIVNLDDSQHIAETVNVTAKALSVEHGMINAGQNIVINVQDNIVARESQLVADNNISMTAGNMINHERATIVAKGDIHAQAKQISLKHASIVSEKDSTFKAKDSIFTNEANISSKGNQSFNAYEIDNHGATFLSEQNIVMTADNQIINHGAHFTSNNLISLSGDQIDNQLAHFKSLGLTAIDAKTVNNQQSSWDVKQLALKATTLLNQQANMLIRQQATFDVDDFDNRAAKILAHDLSVQADKLSGDGQLLAEHDIRLKLTKAFYNQNEIIANHDISIDANNTLINDGVITSGNSLTLTGQSLTNHQTGEISGNQLNFKHETLTNVGLIDGETSNITATTLNNTGSGRIYSDNLQIYAQTLNNRADDKQAPVIAARHDFKIKAETLNNYSHALLLSLGKLAIEADVINNHSARIESGDDMKINAGELNNINDDFETELVKVSEEKKREYSFRNSSRRYSGNEYRIQKGHGDKNYPTLIVYNPDGTVQSSYKYIEYKYKQTHYQTKIIRTDPAEIVSGKNLAIDANHVTNINSKILAGATLQLTAGLLDNIAEKGIDRYNDKGWQIRHDREWHGGFDRDYEAVAFPSRYRKTIEKTLDLDVGKIDDHQVINKNTIDAREKNETGIKVDKNDQQQIQVDSVSTIEPNVNLPNNSLHTVNKNPQSNYLIETDPRFTNRKKWLSSDYITSRIQSDPNVMQKRLGDGYYEQQLIQQQLIALTGQRYLKGYTSDIEQYKALMDAGIMYAEQYQLQLGVALSAEQMANLTSDMVWLVSKTVIVDGKAEQVLVPQVYIVNRPMLTTDGSVLAGRDVQINSDGDIYSNGNILAANKLNVLAENIEQEGIWKGESITVNANDSLKSSGTFYADKDIILSAVNDISLNTTTRTTKVVYGGNYNIETVIDKVASLQSKAGDIKLQAGHDVEMKGAMVIAGGETSQTEIKAGHDIHLDKVETQSRSHASFGENDYRDIDETRVVGTQIESNGSITLQAGHDIQTDSAIVSANDKLKLEAGNDITLSASQEHTALTDRTQKNSKRLLNSKTTINHLEIDNTTQVGSELYGDEISINAGHDLTVSGSQVVGTGDVNLQAGNNVNIDAAEESYYQYQQTIKKESGLLSGGGLGVTIGKMKEDLKQTDNEQAYVGSVVGSTNGNVNIQAGKDINVRGSDIIAQQDVNLKAENVEITSLDAKTTYKEEYSYEKSGLTVALTGTAANIYEAAQALERAKHKDNDKIMALQSIKSGLTVTEEIQNLQLKNDKGQSQASIGVSAMVGTQRTEREVNQEQHNVISSGVSAGKNINIVATGDANKNGGDITLKGSDIKAGNDINLTANRDLNVIGAVNTQHSDRDEKSYGAAAGIQFQVGGDESGLRFKANGNFSREREVADGSAWTESVIDAKNKLNIKTGNDVNVVGGQLKGDTVKMDVGNNLNIQSLQDTDDYDYEKISASVSGTGGTGFSANGSISATNIDSKWASVTDQSGIFAGKGGYDIYVGNNTDLKGAVIASEAEDKSKNKLDTGTISFSDIKNKADFKVTHVSVSGGTGGPGVPTAYQNSDSDSSTTKSAVEKGELIIRNKEQQKQDINELSRDTESANNPLKQIFDKQKELDKIETVELIKDIAQQAKSVMNKYDRIQAQNDVDKNKDALSKLEAEKAYNKLSDAEKAKYKTVEDYYNQNKDYFYYVAVDEQLKTNRENNKNLGGMGSDVSKGIDSAISIVTGIITGNITGGLAGASAPWVAEQIKIQTGDNETARLISHAILGAVVAELQGNSGLAGGAGAVTGELAADIIRKQLYGKDVKDLTEAEKENISALAQLATGLAVASVGGDVGDVSTGIAAGKNAVENNYLKVSEARRKAELSWIKPNWKGEELTEDEKKELEYIEKLDKKRDLVLLETCYAGNISSSACQGLLQEAWQMQNEYAKEAARTIRYSDVYREDSNNLQNILLGLDKDSVSYWKEIEAISKVSGRPVLEVLKEYRWALIADSVSKSLAASMGYNANAGKGTGANKPLDKTALETQHGKGNVEQGGGHYKETKDKILDNQATNQKANESSKFGEHVKKEQEINAGKGTTVVKPTVTAELEVNGVKFKDTNQKARPADKANANESTLIADKIRDKEIATGKELPNWNMANAHAEIGAIQQAHNAGLAKGADLKINVAGKAICSYCRSDIVSAAKAADVKSVTIYEAKTGLTYYWRPGMKKLEVQK
ncbi:filamentous hemagglutinin N-terminal domain-containing protein [Gilliamella sp. ESL0441]|uniref:two-partner secretion domain-containing protein n=1 Tax=Gilliamella sp. ESL0441 TaxID=2704654 RepID=UPI001C694753|nr:hemagglutinin repeat-containing protein [Gilliamella sp. ESL0441]QYN44950.1 filamentous hemagglutinin N-terminal domain-containing protein [Gilliamella sp. ESL0441]